MTTPASHFVAACVQLRASRDVACNIEAALGHVRTAAGNGADLIITPEQTALMELDRKVLFANTFAEEDDPALAALGALAAELGIWLIIGSLAIRVRPDKVANRQFVIDPNGRVVARYDKIHMFDVDLPGGESYRESRNNLAGSIAITTDLPWGRAGLSICYDVRFPGLYRDLARAGAIFLTIPAAFTRTTGEAHWRVLLRARAIETGSFVFAAAQGGHHENGRDTFGHSMIISPWGEILAEAGIEPGVIMAGIDPAQAADARRRIPSLGHDRSFTLRHAMTPPKARAS